MQFSSCKQRGSNLQAAFWSLQLGTPAPWDPIQSTHPQLGSSSETTLSVWEQHRQVNKNNTTYCNGANRPQLGRNTPRWLKELHAKGRHVDWCVLCLPAAVTPLFPFPTPVCPLEHGQWLLQTPIWMLGQETASAWLLPRCTAIPARICVSIDQKKYTEKRQLQCSKADFVPGQKEHSLRWTFSPLPKRWLLQHQ